MTMSGSGRSGKAGRRRARANDEQTPRIAFAAFSAMRVRPGREASGDRLARNVVGHRYAQLEQARVLVVPRPRQLDGDVLADLARAGAEHHDPVGEETRLETIVCDKDHTLSPLHL